MLRTETSALIALFAEQSTETALLLLDRNRRIIWSNRACDRLFGYRDGELPGKPMTVLFTPEDVAKGVPDYEFDVAARSEDMSNDRWMLRSDGSRFWATGNTTGVLDKDGSLIGYGKSLRDSTDVMEQLEAMRNRISALTEASRKKELFLAQLSHELRNPLGALVNAVSLLRLRGKLDPDVDSAVQIIGRQTDSLRGLVNDLLDVARISTGRVQLDLRPLDCRAPIARAIENVQPAMRERRQVFQQHVLDTSMQITGDPQRLEQVFVNLLVNASKYTPEGGRIELRASVNGSEVWVHVIDDGIGISSELLPRVFDLFTRSDDSNVTATEGLGIGLSLVKQFVELHGGTVQVRSDGRNQGSEFTVRLPVAGTQLAPRA